MQLHSSWEITRPVICFAVLFPTPSDGQRPCPALASGVGLQEVGLGSSQCPSPGIGMSNPGLVGAGAVPNLSLPRTSISDVGSLITTGAKAYSDHNATI